MGSNHGPLDYESSVLVYRLSLTRIKYSSLIASNDILSLEYYDLVFDVFQYLASIVVPFVVPFAKFDISITST